MEGRLEITESGSSLKPVLIRHLEDPIRFVTCSREVLSSSGSEKKIMNVGVPRSGLDQHILFLAMMQTAEGQSLWRKTALYLSGRRNGDAE